MTTSTLPATVDLTMLDGEVVRYDVEQRRHGIAIVGPCPACFERLRRYHTVDEAADLARRTFVVDEQAVKALRLTDDLTMDRSVLHAGCFRGRVVLGGWEETRCGD